MSCAVIPIGREITEELNAYEKLQLVEEDPPPSGLVLSWQTHSSSSQLGSYSDSSMHSLISSMPVLPIIAGFTHSSSITLNRNLSGADLPTPIAASVHSLRGSDQLGGSLSGSISPYMHQVMMGASSTSSCHPENNLLVQAAASQDTKSGVIFH
jgi:hypothetical protein